MQSNKYGLQIRVPKSEQKQQQARPLPPKPLAFNDGDDDDVEKKISRQAFKNKSLKYVEDQYKKALVEDPSFFDYGVYDDMKAKIVKPKAEDRQQRQPKYIQAPMEKAKKREKEHEVVYERKLAKERSKDDHLYADKDKFVTGAYKRKLAEQARWIEEERLRELREEKDNVRFYQPGAGKTLNVNYALDSSGARHIRIQGISASARRERQHELDWDEDNEWEEEEDDVEDVVNGMGSSGGPYENYGPFSRRTDDMVPTQTVQVRKGRSGRFVSGSCTSSALGVSGSSRKRSRAVNDSWLVKGPVPGGPADGRMIPSFLGHIAARIWDGIERTSDTGCLKCQTRERTCMTLSNWASVWLEESDMYRRIQASGLSHLSESMHDRIESTLITAFVERWQPDTNSFHMPFGEMTIMLHDVEAILGIRTEGKRVCVADDEDQTDSFAEMFGVDRATVHSGALGVWDHGGVKIAHILRQCLHPDAHRADEAQLSAYFFLLLGCTLFPDKSGNKIRPRDIVDACEPDTIGQFSWGSATLAYLYRQLGFASRANSASITGCLTLLQTWIYEYFPALRPHRDPHHVARGMPRSCAWRPRPEKKSFALLRALRLQLDTMSPREVNWMPFGTDPSTKVPRTCYSGPIQYRDIIEAYMPLRCLRQLGFVQMIPPPPMWPSKTVRPASSNEYIVQWPKIYLGCWEQFPYSASLCTGSLTRPSSGVAPMCDEYYMDWFTTYSHPRLIPNVEHADDADDVDDIVPSAIVAEAYMPRVSHWVHELHKYRDNVTTQSGRLCIDQLMQIVAEWEWAKAKK